MMTSRALCMTFTSRSTYRESVLTDPAGEPFPGQVGKAMDRLTRYADGHPHIDPASVEFYWREDVSPDGCATPDR